MALSCSGKMGMVFLIVINIIFFLLGLGLLITGALMKANVAAINDEIKPVLNTVSISSFNLGDLADNLSVLFIVIGAFIAIVSGLGLFGACCQNKCMLVTYAILVMVLFLMKIVAIALWFTMRNKVEDTVKSELLSSLTSHFKDEGVSNANEISNSWNYMFMSLECCAVNAVNGTVNDFDSTTWCTTAPGTCQAGTYQIPRTCCTGVTPDNYQTAATAACYSTVTASYNTKGCYEAVKDEIAKYGDAFIGVGITILVVELLAIIFAFCICKQAGRDEVV